ncbi:MAG: MXAN_6577-like cysteine-rich protein [Polyangiales bacterium]
MASRAWVRLAILSSLTLALGCATQRTDLGGFDEDSGASATDDTGSAPTDQGAPKPDAGSPVEVDAGDPTPDAGVVEDTGVAPPEDTGGGEDALTCADGQSNCGGVCINTQINPNNCGACGNACAAGERCAAGACASACTGTQVSCGGACVELQTDAANCGMCGRACPSGQPCVAGSCVLTCPAGQTACAGSCVNLQTDGANCGACGTACAMGAMCSAGRCVGGAVGGEPFRVTGFLTTGCRVAEHGSLTGDDRGGIAASSTTAFVTGDTATARLDADALTGASLGAVYDSLVTNLHTGQVFVLASATGIITQSGGTAVALQELDGMTGAVLAGRRVTLSSPVEMPRTPTAGFFSGWDRAVLMAGGRAFHVDLTNGAVLDLGNVAMPSLYRSCENWAIWGVAEFFEGALSVVYVESTTAIARMRIPDRGVTRVSSFTNLGDMCSIVANPLRRRWYFHHEYNSQFGGNSSGETAGYCDATFAGPTIPCPGGQSACGDRCVNLQADTANCGACGTACATGQTCAAGVCGCPSGQTLCGGACVNTQSSTAHCGTCGRACAAGQTCAAGSCACPAGQMLCGSACVDVLASATNCGSCGRTCVGGEWCMAGTCGGGPNYARSTPVTMPPFVSACSAAGRQTVLTSTDDNYTTAAMPFAFRWWGSERASGALVGISSNGFLTMNGTGYTSLSGTIPSTSAPNDVVAPQWRDLVTGSSGVCVATVGAAPTRRWAVEWLNTANYSLGGSLTFEAVFNEGTSVIEFMYGTMSGAQTATVGLENTAGTDSVGGCPDGSRSCSIATNYRVQFVPSP